MAVHWARVQFVIDLTATELVQRLSVMIGMIMEDEAADAVSALSGDLVQAVGRVAYLKSAGEDIVKLAAAAEVIARRCNSEVRR